MPAAAQLAYFGHFCSPGHRGLRRAQAFYP